MRYPPTKPHLIALHELRQAFLYEKYTSSFETVLQLAGDDPFAQLEVYFYYFQAYLSMGKAEAAKNLFLRVHEVPLVDDVRYKELNFLLEACHSRLMDDIQLSETQIDKAISLLEEKTGYLYFAAIKEKIANRRNSQKFEEGIKLCNEIIENAERNLAEIIAMAHTSLGNFYMSLNQIDEAEVHYRYALKLFQSLGYLKDIAGSYSNLGYVASSRFLATNAEPQLLEAIEYEHLALEMIRQTSDVHYMVIILCNIANSYSDLKKFVEAMEYAQEALTLAKSAKLNGSIAHALGINGFIMEKAGHYHESLEYLEECISYGDFLVEGQKLYFYEDICRVCSALSLFEKGFNYSQKFNQFKKEYEKKEKAGIIYHNKILLEKQHHHENELHELQLKSIEEKMQAQATQLITQTEVLAKFRDELRDITRKYPSDNPGMREVKEKLKELPCKSIDWEKFEAEFQAVHPEFTKKLYEQFSELTRMEIKMCSLLRLNLKTHEIARLFCLSERSVETHRFNIRRKLKLDREQSLGLFLNNL
jgi:tetratricopeptide (TPR) repeat protein